MLNGIDLFQKSTFTTLSELLAYFFLFTVPFVSFYFYAIFSRIISRPIRLIWLAQALIYIFLFILVFPGFISFDDLTLAAAVSDGAPSGWHSLTYSFLASSGYILFGGFGLTGAINLLLFLLISLKIYLAVSESQLKKSHKLYLALLVLLLTLHPLNQSQIFYSCRDTVFSLLVFLLGLHYLFMKKMWTYGGIIIFVMALVLLGDLKQEAKLYLVLFPMIFYFLKKWNYRQLMFYGFVISVFGYGYYQVTYDFFRVKSYSRSYEVTAYVLPLSQIFHDKMPSEIPEEHYKNIDAVLAVNLLRSKFNPIDIDPFHAGAFNRNASEAEWQSFKKSAKELIIENPALFLKNRIYLFQSMLHIGHVPLVISDSFRGQLSVGLTAAFERLKIDKSTIHTSPLSSLYRKALYFLTAAANPLSVIISTFLPPLFLLIGCLFFVRFSPSLVAFAFLFAARIPILFLLAPASYTKYIYPLFLFFTFVPALLVLHYLEPKIKSESVSQSRM